VQALLSDTCYVHRTKCISLNLPLRPAAVGCVFNKTWKQKLINSYVLLMGDIDNDIPNTDRLAKISAVCVRKLVHVCSVVKLHTSPSLGLPINLPVTAKTVSQCPLSTYTGHAISELILNAVRHFNAVLCQIVVKNGFLLWFVQHNLKH